MFGLVVDRGGLYGITVVVFLALVESVNCSGGGLNEELDKLTHVVSDPLLRDVVKTRFPGMSVLVSPLNEVVLCASCVALSENPETTPCTLVG